MLPRGVSVSKRARDVHGISNLDCLNKGVDAVEALELFATHAKRVLALGGQLVAHNSQFDIRALHATRSSWGGAHDSWLCPESVFCTMKARKAHSPLVTIAGHKKAFKNDELYKHLYGHTPDWARLHCALDDVKVTMLNYLRARLCWKWR